MAANGNVDSHDDHQTGIKKRIHWRLVERKNPRFFVQSARPESAKDDLKKFVQQNQLQYRHRPSYDDQLVEFEDMFNRLNLNDDESLLERAERRDLPAIVQKRLTATVDRQCRPIPTPRRRLTRTSSALPIRRSAMPDVISDDYAKRRFLSKPKENSRGPVDGSLCYMWLENYENSLNSESRPRASSSKNDPNPIHDDWLSRRIKQSPAARVPDPHPPFGIPNSPVTNYLSTSLQETDYSRAELDVAEELRKQRFRNQELEPHLVNDDLAFRRLRPDVRRQFKSIKSDNVERPSSPFSCTLSFQKFREQLRPVKRCPESLGTPSETSSSSVSLAP